MINAYVAMSPQYVFSPADQMNPIYCIGCRQHIPDDLSKAGRGLCPDCLGKLNATQTVPAGQPTAMPTNPPVPTPAAPVPAAQPVAPVPVALLGACPQCRSPHISEFDNTQDNRGLKNGMAIGSFVLFLVGMATACMGIGLLLMLVAAVMLIVGLCIPANKKIGTSRGCQSCGFRWQV